MTTTETAPEAAVDQSAPPAPLTLEQAVAWADRVGANDAAPFAALDHVQLAVWLRELRRLRHLAKAAQATCDALLFAGHPLVGQVRHILLTALHSDPATALQAAQDLRDNLAGRGAR